MPPLSVILSIYSRKFTQKMKSLLVKTPKKFLIPKGAWAQRPPKYATGGNGWWWYREF